jgi:hypothetical protein
VQLLYDGFVLEFVEHGHCAHRAAQDRACEQVAMVSM